MPNLMTIFLTWGFRHIFHPRGPCWCLRHICAHQRIVIIQAGCCPGRHGSTSGQRLGPWAHVQLGHGAWLHSSPRGLPCWGLHAAGSLHISSRCPAHPSTALKEIAPFHKYFLPHWEGICFAFDMSANSYLNRIQWCDWLSKCQFDQVTPAQSK